MRHLCGGGEYNIIHRKGNYGIIVTVVKIFLSLFQNQIPEWFMFPRVCLSHFQDFKSLSLGDGKTPRIGKGEGLEFLCFFFWGGRGTGHRPDIKEQAEQYVGTK